MNHGHLLMVYKTKIRNSFQKQEIEVDVGFVLKLDMLRQYFKIANYYLLPYTFYWLLVEINSLWRKQKGPFLNSICGIDFPLSTVSTPILSAEQSYISKINIGRRFSVVRILKIKLLNVSI